MLQLNVSHGGKGYNRRLFEDVTLTATGPTVIGLIGENGSGKSTFLKAIAGQESFDEGSINWSREAKIGYLEQEIGEEQNLSGGEKKILKIAELFYSDLNVLLLDEPDNHLDLDHKLWFEQLVKEFMGIIVVISHDRKFLENAVQRIWLLEEGKIKEYPFGYSKFKEVYLGDMASRKHLWEVQEKERLRLADLVRRLQQQAAANDKFVGRFHSAEKRYAKFVDEMVEKPPEDRVVKLATEIGKQHQRKTALYMQDIRKSYGDKEVLKGISLHVFCGEKIAIGAPNGSGKSTLLNILCGKTPLSEGKLTIGPGLKIGYYAQDHVQALDPEANLIEELQKSARFTHYSAIAYLKKFLFDEAISSGQVKRLSGGQKSRLQLAKFLATNPEVLILDEPTNHLDIKTITALENFLQDYAGTLILVSHDRELVENVTDKQFTLKEGRLIAA